MRSGRRDAGQTLRKAPPDNSLGLEEIQSPAIENKGFNVWFQALAIDTKSLPFLISCFRD